MTKTFQTADVCELADKITERVCFELDVDLNYKFMADENGNELEEVDEEVYSDTAQAIFDICFNIIEEDYLLRGYTNENEL